MPGIPRLACLMLPVPVITPKEVNAMLRKLKELLSSRKPEVDRQPQFDGQLLDRNREDVDVLMRQQMPR